MSSCKCKTVLVQKSKTLEEAIEELEETIGELDRAVDEIKRSEGELRHHRTRLIFIQCVATIFGAHCLLATIWP